MINTKEKYGWKPDIPDVRDYKYVAPKGVITKSINLRNIYTPIYDQGQLGSCTANAIASAINYEHIKSGRNSFLPSRLFIYYNERELEGTINYDAGAMIRDGVKSCNRKGVCLEKIWGYNIRRFATKPLTICYTKALSNRIVNYRRLNSQSKLELIKCLSEGFPFVFGFAVYESFESMSVYNTGIVNLPVAGEKLLGGHAVLCVGYDMATDRFIVQNSWGADWGDNGYFTIPADYLTNTNLADDFWTIRL